MEIKNVEIFGLDRAMIAAGNPMTVGEIETTRDSHRKDLKRGRLLGNTNPGEGHDNFLSGITVMFDVKYTQYWSMEFQRYHFAQIVSSQSKMHRLIKLVESGDGIYNKYVDELTKETVAEYVRKYQEAETNDSKYYYFMKALSNTPMGMEIWMTVNTNYLQLKTIYKQRRNHKLKEDWGYFCDWIENLPKFKELILGEK